MTRLNEEIVCAVWGSVNAKLAFQQNLVIYYYYSLRMPRRTRSYVQRFFCFIIVHSFFKIPWGIVDC